MPELYGQMLGGLMYLALAYVVVGLCCAVPRFSGIPHPPRWVLALHNLIGELALLTILIGATLLLRDHEVRSHKGLHMALIVLSAVFLIVSRVSRGGRAV